MVLEIQWLELLGPVVTDYRLLIMDFQWKGKAVHLASEQQINDELLQGKQLMKLTKNHNIVSLYHLKAIFLEDISIDVPDCVQPLLQEYAKNLETPNSLPPFITFDYQIHLKPDATPINVKTI